MQDEDRTRQRAHQVREREGRPEGRSADHWARAEVRINGIVHLRTVLPVDAVVPLGWVAVGDPARILPPDRHDEIWAIQQALDFPGYVFGVERPPPGGSFMPEVMPRYAAFLRRAHAADRQPG